MAINHRLSGWRLLSVAATCILTLACAAVAAADEPTWVQLDMGDGTSISAVYVSSDQNSVTVTVNGAEKQYQMEDVRKLSFIKAPTVAPVAPPPTTPPAVKPPIVPTIAVTPPDQYPSGTPNLTPAPTPVPGVKPVTAGAAPVTAYAGLPVSIEVPLPIAGSEKKIQVKVPLKWTEGVLAPWYKENRASSLHQMPAWTRADEATEKIILDSIAGLTDPAQTTAARNKLKSMIEQSAPYLVINLLDTNPQRAEQCATLLIERGNKDVAKYFIEALFATSAENGKILEDWMQPHGRKLVEGIKLFTGVDLKIDPAQPGFSADAVITFWNEQSATFVPQLGEPEYKPDEAPANAAEQKAEWIKFFRTLALKRVTYVHPVDVKVDLTRVYPRSKDAALDAAILKDIELFGAGAKEPEREAAKARVDARDWKVVAPYIARALLEKSDISQRLVLLDLISKHEDKGLTWHVLNVLITAWGSPTQVPPPNNAALIRIADNQLRKLTGQSNQPAVQPTFLGGYKSIKSHIDYWNQHCLDFPAQYGEPELDKELPKYNDYLKELRVIKDKP